MYKTESQPNISPASDETANFPQRTSVNAGRMLTLFFGLSKTLKMVGRNNDTFANQLEKFWEVATRERDGDTLTIKCVSGRFLVNDRLCGSETTFHQADEASQLWAEQGIGGLEISCGPEDEDLGDFFEIVAETPSGENCLEQMRQQLKTRNIKGVHLLSQKEVAGDDNLSEGERLRLRKQAKAVFFNSLRVVENISTSHRSGKTVDLRGAKMAVRGLVNHLLEEECTLVELASIKDFDDYTYAHSANVCVYSLLIGVRLGLDKKRISQLGLAAMFHDVGKVKLPSDVVKKSGKFDEHDWNLMRNHPVIGARTLFKNFNIDSHTIRGALVAFEHHMNLDNTGYPSRRNVRKLNLFSRIVAVADTFDAMTSGRIYMDSAVSPVETLRLMLYQMNHKYDQLILKTFVNAIGVFPPGSLVLLSDQTIAIIERSPKSGNTSPVVRVIGNRNGISKTGFLLDLNSPENIDLSISRFLDPKKFNIDLKSFILDESTPEIMPSP